MEIPKPEREMNKQERKKKQKNNRFKDESLEKLHVAQWILDLVERNLLLATTEVKTTSGLKVAKLQMHMNYLRTNITNIKSSA